MLMSEVVKQFQGFIKIYGDGLYKDVMTKARRQLMKAVCKEFYNRNKSTLLKSSKERYKQFKDYKEFYEKHNKVSNVSKNKQKSKRG